MKRPEFPDVSLFLCSGSKCSKHKDFRKSLKSVLHQADRESEIEIFKMECTDRCKFAPVLSLQPSNIWYYQCDESSIPHILEEIKKVGNNSDPS